MDQHAPILPDTEPREGDREIIHAVLRLFEVLKAFSRSRPRMTLSEVAEATGLSRASARRFLLTLVQAGYAVSDGKRFALTPKLLELGQSILAAASVWDVARPILAQVSERLGESCYGAVLEGGEVLYVLHIPSSLHLVNVGLRVGSKTPAYCTSVGRVLLAGLSPAAADRVLDDSVPVARTPRTITSKPLLREQVEQARRQGWSLVDEELELGLRSLSVPVRDRDGVTLGAINICGPTSRVPMDDLRLRFLPEMLDAASRIRAALG
ncbi:IclR family transcriptional regulator domain-containing protein [Humitalea sp. 24SJ18S-53]|uniref:IclR family transcriptional regulator domain-containing protein n=1 Tax=Humitalea sp. 24SJ18S-53 TaxID=3422307 RepID=UPI003D67C184